MSHKNYDGWDESDIPGDIPDMSDEMVDWLIDDRKARAAEEAEEMDLERINSAIRIVNANLKGAA